MSKIPAAKIKKYETIVEKLEANQQIWQAIGAMQNAVNDIKTRLSNLVNPIKEVKKRGPAPKSADEKNSVNLKVERRNTLNKKTVRLAGSLYAYVIDLKEPTIDKKELVDSTQMGKKNDKQAVLTAQKLVEFSQENHEKLSYYGVTQEELEALMAATKEFAEVAGRKKKEADTAPKEKPKERISGTKILKEIDDILVEKVDRLLLRFEDSHPDFYKSYDRARRNMKKKKETAEPSTPALEPAPKRTYRKKNMGDANA